MNGVTSCDHFYHRPQRSWAKVIFSQTSVCPRGVSASVHAGIYPESTHPPDQTPPPPREADLSIRSTSGRYASYWNAFLFTFIVLSSQNVIWDLYIYSPKWDISLYLKRLIHQNEWQVIVVFPLLSVDHLVVILYFLKHHSEQWIQSHFSLQFPFQSSLLYVCCIKVRQSRLQRINA